MSAGKLPLLASSTFFLTLSFSSLVKWLGSATGSLVVGTFGVILSLSPLTWTVTFTLSVVLVFGYLTTTTADLSPGLLVSGSLAQLYVVPVGKSLALVIAFWASVGVNCAPSSTVIVPPRGIVLNDTPAAFSALCSPYKLENM